MTRHEQLEAFIRVVEDPAGDRGHEAGLFADPVAGWMLSRFEAEALPDAALLWCHAVDALMKTMVAGGEVH